MALEDIIVNVRAEMNQKSFQRIMKQVNRLKTLATPINKAFSSIDAGMREREKNITNSTRAIGSRLKKEAGLMQEYGRSVREEIAGTRKADVTPIGGAVGDNVTKYQQQQKQFWNNYFKGADTATKVTQGFRGQLKGLSNRFGMINWATQNSQRQFQGWAMSIMFAGMAIQRAFMGIWKNAMKTFNEVHSSIEGTTTGFTKLQGSMKYLWFSVGQALEPLAEALIPIVERITEWIKQNPKLTSGIVKWGAIIGSSLMFIGMFKLGLEGVISAIANLILGLTNLKSLFASISFSKIATYFSTIGKKIATAGSLMWTKFISGMQWIRSNPIKSIGMAGLIIGIVMAIRWIFKMKEAMGGWGELWNNMKRGTLRVLAYISSGLSAIIVKARDMWMSIFSPERRTSLSFSDVFREQLSQNMDKIERELPAPEKGYSTGVSFREFMAGDVYGSEGQKTTLQQPIVINMDGQKVAELTSQQILNSTRNYTNVTGDR